MTCLQRPPAPHGASQCRAAVLYPLYPVTLLEPQALEGERRAMYKVCATTPSASHLVRCVDAEDIGMKCSLRQHTLAPHGPEQALGVDELVDVHDAHADVGGLVVVVRWEPDLHVEHGLGVGRA